jgi:hypothetical protein
MLTLNDRTKTYTAIPYFSVLQYFDFEHALDKHCFILYYVER